MTARLTLSLVLVAALAAPLAADVVASSGPERGLGTPLLEMSQAQVIHGMNVKGNYGGGT